MVFDMSMKNKKRLLLVSTIMLLVPAVVAVITNSMQEPVPGLAGVGHAMIQIGGIALIILYLIIFATTTHLWHKSKPIYKNKRLFDFIKVCAIFMFLLVGLLFAFYCVYYGADVFSIMNAVGFILYAGLLLDFLIKNRKNNDRKFIQVISFIIGLITVIIAALWVFTGFNPIYDLF